MDGAMGSALEWALALLQAPGERHVLRQKPLPQGMDVLLGIAAGAMPDALADAARRLAEPESRIREAARFYAREVLFHPQADAYRVLGVDARASGERIKAHHRVLQLWLHPDRAHGDDDAVFAARVNAAWNRLRTPERRQAYDEALRQQRPPELFDSSGALRGVRAWIPEPEPDADPSRWRRRLPVLVLLALCAVLALLAVNDVGQPSVQWDAGPERAAGADAGQAAEALELLPVARRPTADMAPPAAALPAVAPRDAITLTAATTSAATAAPLAEAAPAERTSSRMAPIPQAGASVDVPTQTPPAAPRVADAAGVQPPAPAPPSFDHLQSARQAGEQLLHYLQSPTMAAPPIWGSPAAQANADRLRQQLDDAGRARFADAQWRIGAEQAVLSAGLIMRGPGGAGRLVASLEWRDGYWLVTGLSMERTQ